VASKKIVVLECDGCGSEDVDVQTRQISVDGRAVEAEQCPACWQKICTAFAAFASHGRALPLRTPVKGATPWPGSAWKFSPHALMRLGERKIDPSDIIKTIEQPTITRPGRASDLEIRERGAYKAVVAPARGIVITCARRAEDDDALVLIEGQKTA